MNYIDTNTLPCNSNSNTATKSDNATDPLLLTMDSRKIDIILNGKIIDLTITSPPYFDVKNYEQRNQIGYGQSYDEYLDDLSNIFKEIYIKTRESGSLWIIIDTFRKNGALIPLPFDLLNKLSIIGWIPKDIIIWKKDKTLPWSGKKNSRNIFEYILVFAKNSEKMKYYQDRIRDHKDLKQWWVKYPERYNPNGKAAERVWEIAIPVQGSWGKKTPRHLCPLPPDLVRQIIHLASDKEDTILDPFAGTGTVLSQAYHLGRKSIGCELNDKFVKEFYNRYAQQKETRAEITPEFFNDRHMFGVLIKQLRILKFARILIRSIYEKMKNDKAHIYAMQSRRIAKKQFSICSADYIIYISNKCDLKIIDEHIKQLAVMKPLSKFGIDYKIAITCSKTEFLDKIHKTKALYCYTVTNSHHFSRTINSNSVLEETTMSPIMSSIKVAVNEEKNY